VSARLEATTAGAFPVDLDWRHLSDADTLLLVRVQRDVAVDHPFDNRLIASACMEA